MSTAYQAHKAKGTTSGCRAGRCRHQLTMDIAVFQRLREAAMANGRGIGEEMAARLAASFPAAEEQDA